MSDDQFLEELKKNAAYKGIDIDREMGKLDAWLLTPKGLGKKKTRGRMVNWLNGVDRENAPSKVAADGSQVLKALDMTPEIAGMVRDYKRSEPGTPLVDLIEKAKRELRRRQEA